MSWLYSRKNAKKDPVFLLFICSYVVNSDAWLNYMNRFPANHTQKLQRPVDNNCHKRASSSHSLPPQTLLPSRLPNVPLQILFTKLNSFAMQHSPLLLASSIHSKVFSRHAMAQAATKYRYRYIGLWVRKFRTYIFRKFILIFPEIG